MTLILYGPYVNAAILATLCLVLARLLYLWLLPKPLLGIPHNPVASIWGDIPAITEATKDGKKTFADYVRGIVNVHGPILQILIGRHPIVVISDRREAERILVGGKGGVVDQSKRTNEIFATVIPTGQIALPANETWKRHRRLTGPSMSRRYLERMSARVSEGASRLVKLWKAKSGLLAGTFDAEMDIQLATMDTIVNITMGSPLGCVDAAYTALQTYPFQPSLPHVESPPLHEALRAMMELIERSSSAAFPSLSAKLFKFFSPKWRKQYAMLSEFFNRAIAQARERENAAGQKGDGLATDADCVLDMIVQREAREGAERFGKDEMLDELMTYVIAGQDTTAASLAWLIKFLPLDSEIQRRLHDEVCAVFGPDPDSEDPLDFNLLDDSERVPVLEAVVAETLRCANVASLTGRELLRDEVILGRHVPKGTQLMFTTAIMSTNEAEWGPDAKLWRPSRWLDSDGAFNRAAGPNIPFGLGQRSCFGQRLAILQMKMFIATLSRAFFFKPVQAEYASWDAVELVTRQPKMCYISLERWESQGDVKVQ